MFREAIQKELSRKIESCVEKMKWLKGIAELFHQFMYDEMSNTTTAVKSSGCTQSELVDIGYFLREMEILMDEMRKDVKARKELASKIMAFKHAQDSISDPDADNIVRGQYSRASIDVKMRVKLPARGTPLYLEVMKFCGVPIEAMKDGLVKLDWNGASDFVSSKMEQGLKIPNGLTETYPEFICVFTKLKDRKDMNDE